MLRKSQSCTEGVLLQNPFGDRNFSREAPSPKQRQSRLLCKELQTRSVNVVNADP